MDPANKVGALEVSGMIVLGAIVLFSLWYLIWGMHCSHRAVRFSGASPLDSVAAGDLGGARREDNMQEIESTRGLAGPYLLFCYWKNCGPCKMAAPQVNLASAYARVPFKRIELENARKDPTLADVRAYPTLIGVRANGAREVYKGERSAAAIRAFADSLAQ